MNAAAMKGAKGTSNEESTFSPNSRKANDATTNVTTSQNLVMVVRVSLDIAVRMVLFPIYRPAIATAINPETPRLSARIKEPNITAMVKYVSAKGSVTKRYRSSAIPETNRPTKTPPPRVYANKVALCKGLKVREIAIGYRITAVASLKYASVSRMVVSLFGALVYFKRLTTETGSVGDTFY